MADRSTQVRIVGFAALIAVVIGVVLVVAADRRDRGTAGKAGNPVVLILSPAHGDREVARQLGTALSQESGLAVEVRSAESRAAAVTAAGQATVDGGILPLFDYLLARQEFGVEAALQLVRGDAGRATTGVIVVQADSRYQAIGDLAGQPVAYVDRASTTGYLLPAAFFAEQRVAVKPVFTGDHAASLALLAKGDVAAAGTYQHDRPGTRVLAAAGAVPNEPVFFHPRMPRETRARLIAALRALAGRPEGRALLGRISEVSGFEPVDDKAYGQVHQLLAATQQRLEDVVPGGRRLIEQERRPVAAPMGD